MTERKEEDASRRLGSGQDNETRYERMYSVQGEAGEDESVSPEDEGTYPYLSLQPLIWFIRLAAITYLALLVYNLWYDDEIRLHVLHATIRVMRAIARTAGEWALECEQSYNEYVDTLH